MLLNIILALVNGMAIGVIGVLIIFAKSTAKTRKEILGGLNMRVFITLLIVNIALAIMNLTSTGVQI